MCRQISLVFSGELVAINMLREDLSNMAGTTRGKYCTECCSPDKHCQL